jgi:signal transduction histidine kinase
VEQLSAADGAEAAPKAAPPRVVQRTHLDLVQIVTGVMLLFEGHAADRGVLLVRDAARSPAEAMQPVYVWGDTLQLKQVVTNLLVNAIKFTPRGGKVTVSVRLAEGAEGPGATARRIAALVVSDTGPGIPPAERERILERGVRLQRDASVPGTGIGLSVVRDLVARHGGGVTVRESKEGGAEFFVRLPLDLRSRSRDALVVLRDKTSIDRVVRALEGAQRAGTLAASRGDLLATLDECGAVVVVPQGADLLAGQSEAPKRSPP